MLISFSDIFEECFESKRTYINKRIAPPQLIPCHKSEPSSDEHNQNDCMPNFDQVDCVGEEGGNGHAQKRYHGHIEERGCCKDERIEHAPERSRRMEIDCDSRNHMLRALPAEQCAELGDKCGQTAQEICECTFEDSFARVGQQELLDVSRKIQALGHEPAMARLWCACARMSALSEKRAGLVCAVSSAVDQVEVVEGKGPAQSCAGGGINIGRLAELYRKASVCGRQGCPLSLTLDLGFTSEVSLSVSSALAAIVLAVLS